MGAVDRPPWAWVLDVLPGRCRMRPGSLGPTAFPWALGHKAIHGPSSALFAAMSRSTGTRDQIPETIL